MKFLLDNQLPEELSRFLASLGCDSIHVAEVGLRSASDAEIWRYACDSGRIVVTKDEDFLYLANRHSQMGGVIWGRLGNCRTASLLSEFSRFWPQIQSSFESGERVVEIR